MLTASLSSTRTDAGVVLRLTVENDGDEPVTLSFRNSKRADFAVRDGDEEVWRWSEGQMFAQMLGSETIEPGSERVFEGTWEGPTAGEYTAVGTLEADEGDVEAETDLSV